MKNVNDYVLEQLARLSEPKLKGQQLQDELDRTRGITALAKISIDSRETDLKDKELDLKAKVVNLQTPQAPKMIGTVGNEENMD
jgi:hypothetical protein